MSPFLGALAFVLGGLAFLGVLVGIFYAIGKRTVRDAEESGSPVERVLADREARTEEASADVRPARPGGAS